MRVALAFLSFLLLLDSPSNAQEASEAFQLSMKEQLFIMKYMNEHPIEETPITHTFLEAHVEAINEVWQRESNQMDAEVSPYLYFWELKKKQPELDKEIVCYLYNEQMVPAFLADIDRFQQEPRPAHVYPIRSGFQFIAYSERFGCISGFNDWVALREALSNLPTMISAYLNSGQAEDVEVEPLESIVEHAGSIAPLIEHWNAFYSDDLNAAFLGLATAAVQGFEHTAIRSLGTRLWQVFAERGETDHALATLDLMARTLSAGDLARDTLYAWYSLVDPERGPGRFSLMTGSMIPALVSSGESVRLTGTYTDLLTDKLTNLEEVNGHVIFLDFWATWCAPCVGEIPALREIVAQYGDQVTFLSINTDAISDAESPEGVKVFMKEHGIDYPVLYDKEDQSLYEQFEVQSLPAKFLINSDGTLLAHPINGRRFLSLADVERHLESMN